MTRINTGRTFVDKGDPGRWYVILEVDSVWSLVWWENGFPRWFPVSEMKTRSVSLEAYDFPVYQLLARWRTSSKAIDEFMERHVYRQHADVKRVRMTRRPLNGRTIDHVRHRHRGAVRGE